MRRARVQLATAVLPLAIPSQFQADHLRLAEVPKPKIYLRPSVSSRRKPLMTFSRNPAELSSLPGFRELEQDQLGLAQPLFRITSPTCEFYSLRLPLLKGGFKRVVDNTQSAPIDCNVLWGKSLPLRSTPTPEDIAVRPWHALMKHNHFPGSHQTFGCKLGLATTLRTAPPSLLAERLSPPTWRIPHDNGTILTEIEVALKLWPSKRYIIKPARGSCGRGIRIVEGKEALTAVKKLVEGFEDKSSSKNWFVVQEYIENPMLIDGRKFDLRLYVTVTSWDPLVCYLHQDGLARYAADQYDAEHSELLDKALSALHSAFVPAEEGSSGTASSDAAAKKIAMLQRLKESKLNTFSHLTNYSIGRQLERREEGSQDIGLANPGELNLKTSYAEALEKIAASGTCKLSPARIHKRIEDVIVRTLIAGEKPMRRYLSLVPAALQDCHFEVLGFDVMLDDRARPWLVEVNTLPSFESSSALDYEVKSNVATDTMNLIGMELFNRSPRAFEESGFKAPDVEAPSEIAHSIDDVLEWTENRLRFSRRTEIEECILKVQDEAIVAGGFKRLFPSEERVDALKAAFMQKSPKTEALWASLSRIPETD